MRSRTHGNIPDAWAARILGLLGLVFLLVAGGLAVEEVRFARTAERVQATVVRYEVSNGRRGKVYCPVLSFTPREAHLPVTARSSYCAGKPLFEVGEPVPILYELADPATTAFEGPSPKWILVAIFGSIGLTFAASGVAFTRAKSIRG